MTSTDGTIALFNIRISQLSYEEVCERIAARIEEGSPSFIVTPNVDHICKCHRDPKFREVYKHAFLSLPDGVPIIWASRLLGCPLPNKLSGSDMVPLLCAFAAEKGLPVFFFGGLDDTAQKSAEILQKAHPDLQVAGAYSPPMGFEKDPQATQEAIDVLRKSGAALCFVALGSPKQELWMHTQAEATQIPVSIGIGGSFDFISGRIPRAPQWMQRNGLEWFWRLCLEPRRLWRRYLLEDLLFFRLLGQEFLRQRCGIGRDAS